MAKLRTPLFLAATAGAAALAAGLTRAYHRDRDAAWSRLDALDKKVLTTPFGAMEYADSGEGGPVLVSHGIFHGSDGGLLSVRDVLPGRRTIAPSRFGYLGSDLPPGATPQAQADAFTVLLDHLQLATVDVVGISAGTTAAIQFALRHPERTRHLVFLSASMPGDPTAAAPPSWAKLLYADLPLWTMKKLAPRQLRRLMGVPVGFPRTPEEAEEVAELVESIFPVGPRAAGAVFDAYVSNPAVNDLPLEAITTPTIIVHAKDDPLCAFAAAEQAAHRIAGCTLVAQESGGHLGLGQSERTRAVLADFLGEPIAV